MLNFIYSTKTFGSEKIRREYLKELKSSNKNFITDKCCLVDTRIDKDSVLIGINSNICKKCSLPIHVKCVNKMGWNHKNCYYCWHDCMIGGEMNVDGFLFKFVTHHNNKSYYYFLRDNDTIKDLISQFLEISVGRTYIPNHYYSAQVMFQGSIRKPDQTIYFLFVQRRMRMWYCLNTMNRF